MLVLGSVTFGQNQSPSPGLQKNSEELGIQGYGRNDTSCLEWSDSCVSAGVINQLKNSVVPTSGLLANLKTLNVCDGAPSLQSPNSLLFQLRSACLETFQRTICGREMVAASPALNRRGVHVPAGPRMYMAACHAAVAVFPPLQSRATLPATPGSPWIRFRPLAAGAVVERGRYAPVSPAE